MKTILWKEWRENIGWALLGMIGAGLMMTLVLAQNVRTQETIAEDEFTGLIACIGAIIGTAIGFLQVIFETRQGHWAVLVHRPISRERLFMGKVVAGLSLYFAAMLIPFMLCVVWVQIPGNVAGPFYWQMTIPGCIDILAGTPYYFAGMLVARRSARWYASRCLPLVAALFCTFLVLVIPIAKLAILTIVVFDIVMVTSVRGAFIKGGEIRAQGVFSKTSLTCVLLIGLVLSGVFIVITVASFLPAPPHTDTQMQPMERLSYKPLRDGRIAVIKSLGTERIAVDDKEGNPIPDMIPIPGAKDPLEQLTPPQTTLIIKPSDIRIRDYRYRYQIRHLRANLGTVEQETWYYLPDVGRFVGYNIPTRTLIGSIGPEGFAKPGETRTDRFAGERLWQNPEGPIFGLFATTKAIYQVNLTLRTAIELFEPEDNDQIIQIGSIVKYINHSPYGMMGGYGMGMEAQETDYEYAGYAISTNHGLILLDNNMNILARHVPEVDTATYGWMHIYKLDEPDRYVLWFNPDSDAIDEDDKESTTPPYRVEIFDVNQGLISSFELPTDTRTFYRWPNIDTTIEPYWGLISPPAPLLLLTALPTYMYTEIGYTQALLKNSLDIVMGLCMLIGAIAGLVGNLWIGHRNALAAVPKTVWAVLGLLLGPCGILLMLCMQDWPARLRCQDCGKPRRVDRMACEHCGASFPTPPTDGTEIFDQAGDSQELEPAI